MSIIPDWVYGELSEFTSKSSKLEKRVCIVGDGDYLGENLSSYINSSEYVVRFNPGKSIGSKLLGFKTDILGLDRFYFTPFDFDSYINDYNAFLLKQSFKESSEVWLFIEQYLLNEHFWSNENNGQEKQPTLEIMDKSWALDGNLELLYSYVRHLYAHYKLNIKMLDHKEYWDLYNSMNDISIIRVNPIISMIDIVRRDSRFSEYEVKLFNFVPKSNSEKIWLMDNNDIFS